jgi:hypothetical protein
MRYLIVLLILLPVLTSDGATAYAQEAALDSAALRGDTLKYQSIVFKQRSVIDIWKECPVVPFPTLDHHLGKITASISVYSSQRVFGVSRDVALLSTSLAALTFETIQGIFFNESFLHSAMDFLLFNFHLPVYFVERKQYFEAIASCTYLVIFYLNLLSSQ